MGDLLEVMSDKYLSGAVFESITSHQKLRLYLSFTNPYGLAANVGCYKIPHE